MTKILSREAFCLRRKNYITHQHQMKKTVDSDEIPIRIGEMNIKLKISLLTTAYTVLITNKVLNQVPYLTNLQNQRIFCNEAHRSQLWKENKFAVPMRYQRGPFSR